MKRLLLFSIALLLCMALPVKAAEPQTLLITNVEIFDGVSEKTFVGHVRVVGNRIERISREPLPVAPDAQVIDGKGAFLMPGLIDAHYHVNLDQLSFEKMRTADAQYIAYRAAKSAHELLMRGFTTIRDVGGNSFSLKAAIDEGMLPGPRMYVSGAAISQTGGHGDFRGYNDVPGANGGRLSYLEVVGHAAIADGVDQVLLRAREQLRQGAVMLKVSVSGGVTSQYDPLDVIQYTAEEIRAAVQAAESWGTFVGVHAYDARAIHHALDAGVKVIEHGHLMDEAAAKHIAASGAWVSTQVFLNDEDATPFPPDIPAYAKQIEMCKGTERMFPLLKQYNIKTAWGTDIIFDPKLAKRHGAQIVKLLNWYTPFEALRMVTATNGELLRLCGPRNPYPHPLGVIAEGAYADILLVKGNPLKNLALVADPDKNFLCIIKDGVVYKNILQP